MQSNDLVLNPIDELGGIRAQIAELRKHEKALEAKVRASLDKNGTASGVLFDAIDVVQIRESLVADKVRGFLHPNQIRAATRVSEVHSLKLTARKSEKVAA